MKCQKCWVSLNLHALEFVEFVFLIWSLQREGIQEASSPLNNEHVKTIIFGGLDYDVDTRNALTKHLNVVVSINTVKRALHEVGLGSSLEKLKHILLMAKNVQYRLEFAHPQD